jgi:hypothetical protein
VEFIQIDAGELIKKEGCQIMVKTKKDHWKENAHIKI